MQLDPDGTYFQQQRFCQPGRSESHARVRRARRQPIPWRHSSRPRSHAQDYGQWGLAAHYLATSLNHTEFGFYYLRYSSRLPVISAITPASRSPILLWRPWSRGTASSSPRPGWLLPWWPPATRPPAFPRLLQPCSAPLDQCPRLRPARQLAAILPGRRADRGWSRAGRVSHGRRYRQLLCRVPEGHRYVRRQLQHDLGTTGISLQGEISYNATSLCRWTMSSCCLATISELSPVFGANNQIGNYFNQVNTEIPGYRSLDVWQAQTTATKVFGPMLAPISSRSWAKSASHRAQSAIEVHAPVRRSRHRYCRRSRRDALHG